MEQPAWLAAAWAEFGVREKAGAANAPAVVGYLAESGHREIRDDATPWCAAFAGAMLARAGITPSGSLMARSYLAWGHALDVPALGALAILSRGADANAGHVGFYLGASANRVFLLGGNQSDAVTVEAFEAARVLGYRWPSSANRTEAAPASQQSMHGIFERCLRHVLAMEGGYSNDPYDPGGPTNKGITLSVLAKWRGVTVDATSRARLIAALKAIDDATVRDIYHARYWQPSSCALLPDAIAAMHFDAAVNHGVGGAIRLLQAALAVAADGEIGPETLQSARSQPVRSVIERYAALRRARYRALPHFWRFGRGWLRRVDATEALALAIAGDPPAEIETAKGTIPMDQDFKFPLPGEIPGQAMAGQDEVQPAGKWWGHSKTVWGALITTLATVLPIIGPLFGVHLPAEVITEVGDQALVVIQAIAGLFGMLLTIYGRSTAKQPLIRRDISLRM